ncbi:hypothetical protein PYW07_005565 [Mythimna separata]|uniref:Uncharacterized protein n=1 Tax=Mythimna separata TaxID=271217 RepID=A0AAD7YJQ7_MYTSE|nr:hypothetical protein PYW07_005565 [Mythimna separata]
MKLFVIAALVAVAAAGRLEHLERSYLPPDNSIGVARSSFGSSGRFGSPSSQGSFGSGPFGAAGAGLQGRNAGNFGAATSNQYLPPNQGPSANIGGSQFGGSLQGLGGQQNFRSQQQNRYPGQQSGVSRQYLAPRSQYGAPQGGSSFGSPQGASSFGSPQSGSSFGSPSYQQFGQQSAAASRQYLAPRIGSNQQPPQQAFDEQTGYQY